MLVSACAKLNLSLEVLGKRDDGFHEIRSVMQTVDLCDVIEVLPASKLSLKCDDLSLEGDSNLAWRAAEDLARQVGRLPLASICIKKRIPLGMGLGGGSSDAAAVLLALNDLWDLRLSLVQLADIAGGLGSDVSFFLWGGAALASGRGEIIEPLPAKAGCPVTLICPIHTVESKTARVYRRLMPCHYSDGGVTQQLVLGMMSGFYGDSLFTNSLEPVAMEEFPFLSSVFGAVENTCGRQARLTGAGPGIFLLPSSEQEHAKIEKALPPDLARAYFVRTLGRGAGRESAARLQSA